MNSVQSPTTALSFSESQAWSLIRALAQTGPRTRASSRIGLKVDELGRLQETDERNAWVVARPDLEAGWSSMRAVDPDVSHLLNLYMPLCVGERSARLIVAHLGQSADGHVATFCGTSKFITGAEDIEHTHRLRALFDVVLVGASTIEIDDPQLTTRLVPGRTPLRVVLDPSARLQPHHRVFDDRAAQTLVVMQRAGARHRRFPDHVDTLEVRRQADGFDLEQLIERLQHRGLHRIFIEGGGVTVSHFLRARLLDRLQLAIAPVHLGKSPKPRSAAPTLETLKTLSRRVRRFSLGADTLFDAELA